jgi:hypothetical protein
MLTKDDLDIKMQIISVLDELKESSNNEVSEQAFDSEQRMGKYKESELDYKKKVETEKKLLAFEKEMEVRYV